MDANDGDAETQRFMQDVLALDLDAFAELAAGQSEEKEDEHGHPNPVLPSQEAYHPSDSPSSNPPQTRQNEDHHEGLTTPDAFPQLRDNESSLPTLNEPSATALAHRG
jgi:hypothetical protein